MKYLEEYKAEIASGKAVIGTWMQKNLEYVENGLKEGRFFYDEKKAELKIKFIENFCHHIEGSNDYIKLETWQKYMIACIFGLVDANGRRQFREVVCVMARKMGKSLLAGSMENAVLFTEDEPGMQIYNLAPKLKQANIIFKVVKAQIDAEKSLRSRVRNRRDDIWYKDKNASLSPLAFAAKKSDGFNPYWVTYDEFAAWPGEQSLNMYNVMQSGGGARKNQPPIHFSCSTANFIDDGLYDQLLARSQNILDGVSHETKILPFIYMIDDEKKWDDLNELKKAMPNLGVSVSEEFIQEEIIKAREDRGFRAEFMTKYCNVKQNSTTAWLTNANIRLTQGARLDPDDFRGCFAMGGVDLSKTGDLTAATLLIQKDGIDYCFTQFFMCRAQYERLTNEEKVDYPKFKDLGYLTISGDTSVNYEDIELWFSDMKDKYDITALVIGYDRWSSNYFVMHMEDKGYEMDDVIQGTNLTPIVNEFGERIRSGKIQTGTNGLLQSHFKNVALEHPTNDNRIRPAKISRYKHIDGFVSVIDAMTVRSKYWNRYEAWLLNEGK